MYASRPTISLDSFSERNDKFLHEHWCKNPKGVPTFDTDRYCSFEYQKMEKILNVSICHVVAESNRCVQGLATAERRAL